LAHEQELGQVAKWSEDVKAAVVFLTWAEADAVRKTLEDPKGIEIIDLNKPAKQAGKKAGKQ